jgi:AcrR family transcriptional regulator
MSGSSRPRTREEIEGARKAMPATAARLLAAAKRIVIRNGYADLSLRRIEKESGANEALVSYYFGNKAGLVSALVDTLFENPRVGYSDDVVRFPEGWERVHALTDWQRRMSANRSANRLLYELLPSAMRSTKLRERLAELYRLYRDFDGQCLESGALGLDHEKTEPLAALSVAVVEGLAVQLSVDPRGFDHAGAYAVWEEMLDCYLKSQTQHSPPASPPDTP